MKKILSVLLAFVLMSAMLVTSVCADTFVPSIGYKPAPDIDDDKDGCIIITSVEEAETTTKIPRVIADSLLEMYAKFSEDDFRLSSVSDNLNDLVGSVLGDEYDADSLVIRDFFNIESLCEDMDAYLIVDGQTMTVTFDIDPDGKPVFVMVYVPGVNDDGTRDWENGEWQIAESKDNGDGSVSVTFEDFGHVAVMVPDGDADITPPTGDDSADNTLWITIMIGASLLVAALLVAQIRSAKRKRV